MKYSFYFEHFQKKTMTLIADIFRQLSTPKNVVRSISKKSRFRATSAEQRGKPVQTLLKSEQQHIYHIH